MTSAVFRNIFRFIGLWAIQVLVLRSVVLGEGWLSYPHVVIYPLFLILLPLRTPHALIVFLGFLMGFGVDLVYGTYGIHASASVFTGFIRPTILSIFTPRGGYNINHSPTAYRFGSGWFLRYAALLMLLHLFFYFSVDAFTFVYIVEVLLKTFASFLLSMLFIVLYQIIINPKE